MWQHKGHLEGRGALALRALRDGEDGLLTALEVIGLDLRGTQLVVLSACETGLGQIETGEGVFGLRRAFTIAGAESQVLSLWSVEDRATSALMVDFYERLGRGEPRGQALGDAQRTLLANPATTDPYYWAAFQISGQWGVLVSSQ